MLQGKIPDGAIIAPVILASDKTQLLQFCSDTVYAIQNLVDAPS